MFWLMIIISLTIALSGLVYIFYPTWLANLLERILNVPTNILRLYGLILLAIATIILYYVIALT